MTYIVYSPEFLKHETGLHHPEAPGRVSEIFQALEEAGLVDSVRLILPRKASFEELCLCHTSSYVQLVEKETEALKKEGRGRLKFLSTGDVVISENSYDVALFAVGAVLEAADTVMEKGAKRCFCVVRPPGHHATSSRGMGFCIFNNVAIGARYLQKKYKLKRILICDWDVHHGNGTQEIFDDDPSIFYFSTHQKGIYPGTGGKEECGKGEAYGTKMNFPILPEDSRRQVCEIFEKELPRAMETFRPEFILISCGFDLHSSDPLGRFDLHDEDIEKLTKIVKAEAEKYANGRIISVLEGGYNLAALRSASVAHVRALS
jgi:acetoin utilization deacetylase AcuC-like enzyme